MTPGSQAEYIEKTAAFVRRELEDAEAGHDWQHIQRVLINARAIAAGENVNILIVELGALLHDIADAKFHGGDEEIGPQKAGAFLRSLGLEQAVIDEVQQIIRYVSFKGGQSDGRYHSAELAVVQDADRLDALGAIGIARTFHYGGFRNRTIYDAAIAPRTYGNAAEYHQSEAPTINHFYGKLLLLKDRMHTETGRRMATERHAFMEAFLGQFFSEMGATPSWLP